MFRFVLFCIREFCAISELMFVLITLLMYCLSVTEKTIPCKSYCWQVRVNLHTPRSTKPFCDASVGGENPSFEQCSFLASLGRTCETSHAAPQRHTRPIDGDFWAL